MYALAVDDGSLLAATGNRGRMYRVDVGGGGAPGRFTDVGHLEAAQGMAFAAVPGGLIVGTSNSGKVFRMEDKAAANATYTSEVFDAQGFTQWGRMEVLPETAAGAGFELFARSGNVESPLMGWSEWAPVSKLGVVTVPAGRYAQWKAVLHAGWRGGFGGGELSGEESGSGGGRCGGAAGERGMAAGGMAAQNTTVQVAFPVAGPAVQGFVPGCECCSADSAEGQDGGDGAVGSA